MPEKRHAPHLNKILVVDDAAANRQLLTNLLMTHGYTVHPASDGELAMEFIHTTLPDLILLDIRMPGMDGFELCRRLKADERTNAIPIIFISISEDEHEKVKAFQAGAVDYITKPFQSEEVLARVRNHLHLQELTDHLREQTIQLEATNRELEAFAYSVSHDLRAPLRHIDGFLELLKKEAGTALNEQSRHYMEAICKAAKKMGLLIDDLLSFSRMGRHALSFEQVALGRLVREVVRELEPDSTGKTIEWRIGGLPSVQGDERMLRIVLTNLISNALKFTRTRPQAWIEIGSLPAQEAEVVIYVRDNGVGFDMNYADKLFCVFQRLHRADEFEGTGVGLATVNRIIARHGPKVA
jgi:DNA-binding response OmpR family regulator